MINYIYMNRDTGVIERTSDSHQYLPEHVEIKYSTALELNTTLVDFKLATLRAMRDEKLLESDALFVEVLSKGNSTTSIESYKQTLRDLPTTDLTGKAIVDLLTLLPLIPAT